MRATIVMSRRRLGGEGGIVRGRTAVHPSLRSGPTAGLRSSPTLSPGAAELNPPAPGEHHARLFITIWRRGWDSNPRTPVEMLLEFQSSALDRPATSPINYLRLPRRRGLPGLERRRLIQTRLPALARRRRRLVERRYAQRAAGLGGIESGGSLHRRNALRAHVRLRPVTGLGPQRVASAQRQQQRGEPDNCADRLHS